MMQPPDNSVCSRCSKEHQQFPVITFDFPAEVSALSEGEAKSMVEMDGDFCSIHQAGVTERFIRCEFIQKITGRCETVNYFVWIKLGERSYQDYKHSFGQPHTYGSYGGFMSNELPHYTFWQNIPVTVYRRENQKPDVLPHRNVDHPLVKEYYNGIALEIARERVTGKQKSIASGKGAGQSKPWWNFWQPRSVQSFHGA